MEGEGECMKEVWEGRTEREADTVGKGGKEGEK